MRSRLIYIAAAQVSSRFELVMMTARATRILHRPKTCIGRTINQALERIAAQGERVSQ